MRVESFPKEFTEAMPVLNCIEEAGFDAYFVGGSVRDLILGKPIHDVDIATSAYPEEVKGLFKRTVDVGIDHGTVLVLYQDQQYEITTFRTESTYQDYRRPDEVTFVRSLSEDLKRRDFTINALAMNQQGEIIDLFKGLDDLKAELIRAVGSPQERFKEDALRMMRCLRFASQLDFTIEATTLQAVADHHQLLEKISIERVQIEYVKLMMGKNRQRGLVPFIKSNCFRYCPGFAAKEAQLTKLTALPAKPITEEALVWLLTVVVLEIPETENRRFLSQWKNSNQLIKQVTLLREGLVYRLEAEWTNQWLYKLGAENIVLVEKALVYFDQPTNVAEALAAYQKLPIKAVQELAISGSDLLALTEQKPGPWVGQLVADIEAGVLAGRLLNQRSELIDFATMKLKEEGADNYL